MDSLLVVLVLVRLFRVFIVGILVRVLVRVA